MLIFSNYSGEIKNLIVLYLMLQINLSFYIECLQLRINPILFKKSLAPNIGKKKEKFIKNMKLWRKSSIEEALFI